MEEIVVGEDVCIGYVTADSFPAGIAAAQQELHAMLPFAKDRKYVSVSRPENGTIVYRAGATISEPWEVEEFGNDTLVVKKGRYVSETVYNFISDIEAIGRSFEKLLQHPGIDPDGYCVEWYLNEDNVRCMVRLRD